MQEKLAGNRLQIEQHGHGGDTWSAAEQLGVPREHLLDFSANINPLGPPNSIWQAIQQQLSSVASYPDPQCRGLKLALAEKWGVSTAQLLVGNGAAEILYGLFAALAPQKVGLLQPCFSEYAEAAAAVGAEVVPVVASEECDFLPTLSELLAVCEQVDVMVLGNPNNPNGRLLPIEWLAEMAVVLGKRQAHLLVDEAFLDFLPHTSSLLTRLEELPHVILLRSMTKFYSIPGLRLGYAIAAPEMVRRVEKKLPPWRVNSLAQAAGIAGLQDQAFEKATWEWMQQERAFLVDALQMLPGVRVYSGEVNFVLFRCLLPDLQRNFGERGILIRSCADYPGLGLGYYRVAVRSHLENVRLLTVFKQLFGGEKTCPMSS